MRLSSYLTLAILLLLIGPLYAGAGFRTITSEDGKEIRAKILRANQNDVWIERDDGRTFQVPLSRLIEENRVEILAWRLNEGAFPPNAFRFSTSRYLEGPQQTRYEWVSYLMSDGSTRTDNRGIQHIIRETGYTVTVENRRSEAVEGLRAEYLIFTRLPHGRLHAAARGTEDLGAIRQFGKIEFKTSTVTTTRTTNRHSGNRSSSPSTELAGVWVRIYQGSIRVGEFSIPNSLSENEEWGR